MKNTTKKIVAGTVGAAGLLLATSAATANADSVQHHVVKDDTVWALSQKYGVSIKSIEQLNHIDEDTNMIYVGQDLQIPGKNVQTPKKDNTHTYVVKEGDSLWTIAQRYHMTVDQLRQLNGLTSSTIYVGQTLKLDGQATPVQGSASQQPAKKVTTTQSAPAAKAPVQSQAQSSVKESAPATSATKASSQQTAQSSTKAPVASVQSSVAQQQSSVKSTPAVASSASQSSSATQASSVSSSAAQSSSVAQSSAAVSSSNSSAVVSSQSSQQAVIAANHTTYTVKSGDTLYTIAEAYGVSVQSLREANPNVQAALTVGQQLIINNPTKDPVAEASSSAAAESSRQASISSSQAAANEASRQSSIAAAQASSAQQTQVASSSSSEQTQQNQNNNNNNNQATTNQTATSSSTQNTGSGSTVVEFAKSLIGTPYVYGGTTPSGFDCSGFVQYVYNHFGVSLPRTTTQQENCGTQISVDQAQPGDLYFWGSKGSTYHVAIAIGNGQYVAAPEPGQSVSIGSTQYFQPSFAVRL